MRPHRRFGAASATSSPATSSAATPSPATSCSATFSVAGPPSINAVLCCRHHGGGARGGGGDVAGGRAAGGGGGAAGAGAGGGGRPAGRHRGGAGERSAPFSVWRPYLLLLCAGLYGGLCERLYTKVLFSASTRWRRRWRRSSRSSSCSSVSPRGRRGSTSAVRSARRPPPYFAHALQPP